MENSASKEFVTLSQPLEKKTWSESNESESSWHIEMKNIATSLACFVVENIRQGVTKKLNGPLESLNNSLNVQLVNIVHKLETPFSEKTMTLKYLSDKVEDVKTEQHMLRSKLITWNKNTIDKPMKQTT